MNSKFYQTVSIVCFLALVSTPLPGFAVEEVKTKKPPENHTYIEKLELKEARVVDALRLISEYLGVNVVVTEEASKKTITLFLRNTDLLTAVDTIAKIANMWYREDREKGIIRMMTTEEYQRDLVVYRDDETRVFTLLHPNALATAIQIRDLHGDRVVLSLGEDLSLSTGAGGISGAGLGLQAGLGFDTTNISGRRFATGGQPFRGLPVCKGQIFLRVAQDLRGVSVSAGRTYPKKKLWVKG